MKVKKGTKPQGTNHTLDRYQKKILHTYIHQHQILYHSQYLVNHVKHYHPA